MGLELEQPVLSEAGRQANFTNERGIDGTVRYLRNVMGLWILQDCLGAFGRSGEPTDLEGLIGEAARLPGLRSVIDVDDPVFLPPGDMPRRIADACAPEWRAAATDTGRTRALHSRQLGSRPPANDRRSSRPHRTGNRCRSHGRRWRPQPPPLPAHSRRPGLAGRSRTRRGDHDREPARAGPRPRLFAGRPRGDAGSRPPSTDCAIYKPSGKAADWRRAESRIVPRSVAG